MSLESTAITHLRTLTQTIPGRRTGSPGNRAATDYFAATIAAAGFAVETPSFDCLDWIANGAELTAGGQVFTVAPSPYSLGCDVRGPLVAVATLAELAAADLAGSVLLMRGELTEEQLTPKNYPFYQVDAHQELIRLLEDKQPLAIITATARNPEMAGGIYPFPLIEDGDFDIASVYMTDSDGDRLVRQAGEPVSLISYAVREQAIACNVIARRGGGAARGVARVVADQSRLVAMAHIDAKAGTPGALDNATGVTTLLLLADLLRDYDPQLTVEIAAINGEDYYSAPGEMHYMAANEGRLEEIVLTINLDGVGYRQGRTAYSLYECPDTTAALIREAMTPHRGLVAGKPWYQGDHMIMVMNGRPALALTSAEIFNLMATVIHTSGDTPDLVDPAKLVETAAALRDLILLLDTHL